MLKHCVRISLGVLCLSAGAWAESGGAPVMTTGAPADGGICTDCHGGVANAGKGKLQVSLVDAATWTPGQQLKLRVTLSDPNARRWGFNLTARSSADSGVTAGTLAVVDNTLTQIRNAGNLQFATHRAAGTRPGTTGSSTWEELWTPPADAAAGEVTFYAAGNAANGNGSADSGDSIYSTTLQVKPAASAPTLTRIAPRIVLGDTWNSSVYLYNTTTNAASAKVEYFGDDGNPLVGLPGGATASVDLGARGSALLDASAGGPLTTGYAVLTFPEGVTGYVVLKQSEVDKAPVETILPLSGNAVKSSTLAWDETNWTTMLALANPGSAEITVTLTVRDPAGQVLATSDVKLASKAKTEFNLKDRAEFSVMSGGRGTVDLSVSDGSFAVTGFRVGAQTLAAIPSSDR